MGSPIKYYKLGEKSSNFFDAATRLKISNEQVVSLPDEIARLSGVIKLALKSGHIEYATKEEFDRGKRDNGNDMPEEEDEDVDDENSDSDDEDNSGDEDEEKEPDEKPGRRKRR